MEGSSLLFYLIVCVSVGNYRVLGHMQTGDYLLESYPTYSIVLPVTGPHQSFVVQSPRFHRVMAVIQFLNIQPTNDFTCSNFLQFQDGAEKRSQKICGNFDPDEKGSNPVSLIGERSYLSSRETLKVTLDSLSGVEAYARVAFTAFRDDCYFPQPKTTTTEPRYRPCEYSISSDGIGKQCILSSLFCDQVLNCAGMEGKDFGQDESDLNCPQLQQGSFSSGSSGNESGGNLTESDSVTEDNGSGVVKENSFKKFFDEREEHLANLFKSAIIGFVGICTVCILVAFVITMFCVGGDCSSRGGG